MNTLWTVTYGNYELSVDRRTRTYRLVETRTGTVWGDGLSLGWMDLKDRATGMVSRHDFGAMKVYSVSEKAGPQGKRILFGLDYEGVPLDIYLICSEREIQMVVESNRDSATHTVEGFGLLPGLCSIPDDDRSYFVIPYQEGVIVRAREVWSGVLPIWDPNEGVSMPFIGVIRQSGSGQSALSLITDSAYGSFSLWRKLTGPAMIDPLFSRDPERRRLDVRLVLLPEGDHVAVARTYRQKLISDANHVTLRQKMRNHTSLEQRIGKPFFVFPWLKTEWNSPEIPDFLNYLQTMGVPEGFLLLPGTAAPLGNDLSGPVRYSIGEAIIDKDYYPVAHWDFNAMIDQSLDLIDDEEDPSSDHVALLNSSGGFVPRGDQEAYLNAPSRLRMARQHLNYWQQSQSSELRKWGVSVAIPPLHDNFSIYHPHSRWDDLESHTRLFQDVLDSGILLGTDDAPDWTAYFVHFWLDCLIMPGKKRHFSSRSSNRFAWVAPLYATVYHDCVMAFPGVVFGPQQPFSCLFYRSLLSLSPPLYIVSRETLKQEGYIEYIAATSAVLCALHRLTFTTFLTAHRFLTPDFRVEEAVYSDRTRVVINQSETEVYETEEFALPPGGFYVRHAQMLAHDALRVGDEVFPTRAWRVWRARDGNSLETSRDVAYQEFPDTSRL